MFTFSSFNTLSSQTSNFALIVLPDLVACVPVVNPKAPNESTVSCGSLIILY